MRIDAGKKNLTSWIATVVFIKRCTIQKFCGATQNYEETGRFKAIKFFPLLACFSQIRGEHSDHINGLENDLYLQMTDYFEARISQNIHCFSCRLKVCNSKLKRVLTKNIQGYQNNLFKEVFNLNQLKKWGNFK